MIKATLLRPGMIIKYENDLAVIYSVDHRTPGNKRGSMQTKMRNLRTGSMIDYRFRAEESLDKVVVDEIAFEYLYSDAEGHHFMNTENYEQIALQNDIVGDTKDYLIANMPVKIEYYDGKAIGVLIPDTVDLKVIDETIRVSDRDSFLMARRITREEGLLVGGSSGTAAVAAVRLAKTLTKDAIVVVILPDSGRGYMSKIFNDEWMIANGFLEDTKTKATVGDVLRTKQPLPAMIAIGEDDVVKHALDLLRENEISQLPVMRDLVLS